MKKNEKLLTEDQKNKKYPMRLAAFNLNWMNLAPALPEPKIDWINEKILDISYGEDQLQKMDLYYPNNHKKDKYPLIIIIHGGGWTHMDKRDWHLYPGFFGLEEGFVVVSMNYRLAPKNKYLEIVSDIFAGYKYILDHAEELKIDTNKIVVMGPSAGGNLSLILAFREYSEGRNNIKGVAALCPAIDPIKFCAPLMKKNLLYKFIIKRMIKKMFGYYPKKLTEIDASYYLTSTKTIPPLYFQVGRFDPAIPYNLILEYRNNWLKKYNLNETYIILDTLEAYHMGATHHWFEDEVIKRYIAWFKEILNDNNDH